MEYGSSVQFGMSCLSWEQYYGGSVGDVGMVEELLAEGCWVETTLITSSVGSEVEASSSSSSSSSSLLYYLSSALGTAISTTSDDHQEEQEEHEQQGNTNTTKRSSSSSYWWIGPPPISTNKDNNNTSSSFSVKDRLVFTLFSYLKDQQQYSRTTDTNNTNTAANNNNNNNNLLFQIWVPPRRNHLHHLLSSNITNNNNHHDNYYSVGLIPCSTNQNSSNPNVVVRFFRSLDYSQQHYYDINVQGGSMALPVFERGTATCLGVLQILIIPNHTTSFFNHRPSPSPSPPPPPPFHNNTSFDLQGVDFRSTCNQNLMVQAAPAAKVYEELYEAAVNEILEVLTSVCKTHCLPLALTWAPCLQQPPTSKSACPHNSTTTTTTLQFVDDHFNNNFVSCVSTVDSACLVADLDMLGFQEACSEYHLFRGQGIVGTAFSTSKPCFAIDITAFSKAEYPLSPHANLFGLHAAVAIPLRWSTVYTAGASSADFVLEFFLPKDCHDPQHQKHMLHSLSLVVQQSCRSLHVAVAEDEFTPPPLSPPPPHIKQDVVIHHLHQEIPSSQQVDPQVVGIKEDQSSSSSWIAHMMEAQQKGKGVCVSLEYQMDQEPKQEFKVTTNWDHSSHHDHQQQQQQGRVVFSDFGQVLERSTSVEGVEESHHHHSFGSGGGRRASSGGRKTGEKRRTKAEKTISLPILRQYFAGSLKDAAKSIGVCPTTLKRICRQHGITRWPSRKIKKVGHSLKKLQLVIDSVQGAEGAIQIGSFYSSFPELSSANATATTTTAPSHSSNSTTTKTNNTLFGHAHGSSDHGGVFSTLKSPQYSATCTHSFRNQLSTAAEEVAAITENPVPADALMFRSHEAELHNASLQVQLEDTKHLTTTTTTTPNTQSLATNCDWRRNSSRESRGAFRVKATFADEKIRFSLQPVWGFADLQLEIARRFNLNDVTNIVLKYLDDDGEWVVLACDGDLEECKDLHTTSQSRTIRLSLFQASPLNLASNNFPHTSPSS